MTGHNGDPQGILFNGEPASLLQIGLMEQASSNALDLGTITLSRQYERTTDDGAIVQFKTLYTDERDTPTTVYTIAIGAVADSVPAFELSLSDDASLVSKYCPGESSRARTGDLAKELLRAGRLNRAEQALVWQMYNLASFPGNNIAHGALQVTVDDTLGSRPMAHVIGHAIQQANPYTLQRREFDHTFDSNHDLIIVEHAIIGQPDVDDVVGFYDRPVLQIEYADREQLVNRCYTKTFAGQRKLEVCDPADLLEELFRHSVSVDEELSIASQKEEAGMFTPGEVDVELLRQKIIDAHVARLSSLYLRKNVPISVL